MSDDFQFAAAVAAFGMILRDSKFKGNATVDQVLALAKEGQDEDREGYRAGFIRLVQAYEVLAEAQASELSIVRE